MAEPIIIETDGRGHTVLPGHPSQRFLMHVTEDGSVLLQPTRLEKHAQSVFDSDPELRDVLARASPTVRRSRRRR